MATKNGAGSSSIAWRVRFARSRRFTKTSVAAAATPISNDVVRSDSPPSTSGMKPELSSWNVSGNGPTDWPCSSARLRPLKTSMPASVTMNDGMRKNATNQPCAAPIAAPASRQATVAGTKCHSNSTISTAASAPTKPTTEPTDRSMWPATITSSMPSAMMTM